MGDYIDEREFITSSSGTEFSYSINSVAALNNQEMALRLFRYSILFLAIMAGICALFGFISWYIAGKKLNLN
jgi:hypothetical protein